MANTLNIVDIFKGFQKLESAREYSAKHPSLRIWAEDRPSSMAGGKNYKYFWVGNIIFFVKAYLASSSQYFYEVIHISRPARLYLDIEFLKKQNPFVDGESRVKAIINKILRMCENDYDIITSFEEVVILDASDTVKFSHHVIFPDVIFPTNIDCKYFVEKFCEQNQKMVYIGPHNEKENMKSIVDLGVYTKWRNFRLWKCYKLGQNRPLIISKLDKHFEVCELLSSQDEHGKSRAHELYFHASLVNTDQKANMPVINNIIKNNLKKSDTFVFKPITYPNSSPWLWIDMLVKQKVLPATVRNIQVKSTGFLLYNLMGEQFCRIANRHHKNNNTYIMVDPNHKYIIQKCYHPKCETEERLVHFIKTKENKKITENDPKTQDLPTLVVDGLEYAQKQLELLLRPFSTKVIGDGNCLMRAYILAVRDPAISNQDYWLEKSLLLRREAIDFVRCQISHGNVDWGTLIDMYPKIDNWDNEYSKLRLPGAYTSDAADTMPQVISSYTGSQMLIINLNANHTEFVLPEHIFNGTTTRKVPIVLIRNNDHFETLDVPLEEEARLIALFNKEQVERKCDLQHRADCE